MAYILPEDEQQEQAGGGGGAIGGAAPAPAMGSRPDETSTGFVSWDRILSANKDAATKQANKLGDKVAAQAQGVQKKSKEAMDTFNQGVQASLGSLGAQNQAPKQSTNGFGQPISPVSPTKTAGKSTGFDAIDNQPSKTATTTAQTGQEQVADGSAPTEYKGPNSLSEGTGWDAIMSQAGDASSKVSALGQRDEMGHVRGDAGIEALNAMENPGATPGGNRFDAALMGSTGRSRFNQLQSQYGKILDDTKAMDDLSKASSDSAKLKISDNNSALAAAAEAEKHRGDAVKASNDKEQARRDAEEAANAPYKGKSSWDDYNNENQLENTVKDVGSYLDPIALILKATGNRTAEDVLNEKMEGWANKNLDTEMNSAKIRWSGVPLLDERQKHAVYESMTTEELHQVERLPQKKQHEWIMDRWKKLNSGQSRQSDKEIQDSHNKLILGYGG